MIANNMLYRYCNQMLGPDKNGVWKLAIKLKPGFHEFKYIIDGAVWFPGGGQSNLKKYVKKSTKKNPLKDLYPVIFRFNSKKAKSVWVAGSFNKWGGTASKKKHLMKKKCFVMQGPDEAGRWGVKVLLPPGKYSYKFIIDGVKWQKDLNAKKFEDDGFGDKNSVVTVGPIK